MSLVEKENDPEAPPISRLYNLQSFLPNISLINANLFQCEICPVMCC